MNSELTKLSKEIDNPFEAFIAGLMYILIEFIMRMSEVVVEFGENT